MKSVFLSNLHYFYSKTDGTYGFPNSSDGDLLKQAKKEIENMRDRLNEIWELTQFDWDTMPEQGRKDFRRLVSEIADEALKN